MTTGSPRPSLRGPPRSGTLLVGRKRELAELRRALDDTLVSRGTVVLVGGEAGIGKTSLASALADEAEARGAAAVWGLGWKGHAAPTYWGWAQVVRALIRSSGGPQTLASLGTSQAWLSLIVPELAGVEGPSTAGG